MYRICKIITATICSVSFSLWTSIPLIFADDSVVLTNPAQLLAEFHENALVLELKYARKQIQISGVITSIKKDLSGLPVVTLVSPINHIALDSPFAGVIEYSAPINQGVVGCQFKGGQIGNLVKLKKNQQIIALCDLVDITGGSATLRGCEFIRLL
jgi:hypothetical protein